MEVRHYRYLRDCACDSHCRSIRAVPIMAGTSIQCADFKTWHRRQNLLKPKYKYLDDYHNQYMPLSLLSQSTLHAHDFESPKCRRIRSRRHYHSLQTEAPFRRMAQLQLLTTEDML